MPSGGDSDVISFDSPLTRCCCIAWAELHYGMCLLYYCNPHWPTTVTSTDTCRLQCLCLPIGVEKEIRNESPSYTEHNSTALFSFNVAHTHTSWICLDASDLLYPAACFLHVSVKHTALFRALRSLSVVFLMLFTFSSHSMRYRTGLLLVFFFLYWGCLYINCVKCDE